MKRFLFLSSILVYGAEVMAEDNRHSLSVNHGAISLSEQDFTPIKTNWAGREFVTGYQTLIDVTGASDKMFFEVSGEVSTRWFASNFGLITRLTCNGIPIGLSKDYGQRVNRKSIPAKPSITELRANVSQCNQLKLELKKVGSLSRQFFTPIENIEFNIELLGPNNMQGER